jgi:hypothetical protein
MFFWLAYCMALGFFIFYVPVFSLFFFFSLFPIIIFQNLMSDTNTGYHRMRGGRGGNLRALDHFWREEGRDGVGRQRERERERERERQRNYTICWFKKGHGSGSKV